MSSVASPQGTALLPPPGASRTMYGTFCGETFQTMALWWMVSKATALQRFAVFLDMHYSRASVHPCAIFVVEPEPPALTSVTSYT